MSRGFILSALDYLKCLNYSQPLSSYSHSKLVNSLSFCSQKAWQVFFNYHLTISMLFDKVK